MSNQQQQRQMMDAYDDATKLVSGDSYLVLPQDTRLFEVASNGISYIDVVPYATVNNPKAQPGQWAWMRAYHLHRNLGLDGRTSIVCPRDIGGACPICEMASKLSMRFSQGDAEIKKAIKGFQPKQRTLFNVIDLEHPDLGIQVFDVSHYLFTKLLGTRIAKASQTDKFEANWRYFADPENGLSLKITWSSESFEGRAYWEASSIDFRPRDQQYDAEGLVEMAPVLDDCIASLSYEEIAELLGQTPSDLIERGDTRGGAVAHSATTGALPPRRLPTKGATAAPAAKAAPRTAKPAPPPVQAEVVQDEDWGGVPESDGVEGDWSEGAEADTALEEGAEEVYYNEDGSVWVDPGAEVEAEYEQEPTPAPARPAKAAPRPAKAAPRPPAAAAPARPAKAAPRPAKAAPRPPAAAAPARPAKAAPRPPAAAAPARPAKAAPRPPAAAAPDPNFEWE